MAGMQIRNFDNPDETRPFEGKGSVESISLDDGSDGEIGPGDVFSIPAGHDAEVIGDEPCVMVDIGDEDADYAKRV